MAAESDDKYSTSSEDEEEYSELGDKFTTFVDFESEESAPNVVTHSFLRDCIKFPKILCHKEFLFFRNFLGEVGGICFTMPPNSPYYENHEDTLICVDLGDKMLQELRYRIMETSNDDLWASMRTVERKNDLGLSVLRWELLPMTRCYLMMYIDFCKQKLKQEGKEKGQNLDRLDRYIVQFKKAFKLSWNVEVEDTYYGDLEATRLRILSGKVEPPPLDLETVNKECPPPFNSKNQDTSDTSSETNSDSKYSEYKGKPPVKRKKAVAKVANGVIKKPSSSSGKPNGTIKKPPNGVIKKPSSSSGKPNGTIKKSPNGLIKPPNGVIKKPPHGKNGAIKPNGVHKTINKGSTTIPIFKCDICQPTRVFATKRILYKHVSNFHSTTRRGLVTCKCGSKVKPERYEFHKEFCKKHAIVIS